MSKRRALGLPLLLVVLTSSGCLFGRSGGIVFPARYDIGALATTPDGRPGYHFAGGLHWASVSPDARTPIDVGVGYIVEDKLDPDEPTDTLRSTVADTPPNPENLLVHGPYLEISRRLSGDNHRRTWLGVRAELLMLDDTGRDGDATTGVGLTVRAGAELFATTKGRNAVGVGAIGVFIEAGARRFPDSYAEEVVIVGFSFRLPLAAVH